MRHHCAGRTPSGRHKGTGFCKCPSGRTKPAPRRNQAHVCAAPASGEPFFSLGHDRPCRLCNSIALSSPSRPIPQQPPGRRRRSLIPTNRRFIHALRTMTCRPVFPQETWRTPQSEATGVLSTLALCPSGISLRRVGNNTDLSLLSMAPTPATQEVDGGRFDLDAETAMPAQP